MHCHNSIFVLSTFKVWSIHSSLTRKLREKDVSKFHIQLSLALLLMFVVVLVLIILSALSITPQYEGCVTLSLLVHYFALTAVMWMGAEALLMFQKLVTVFFHVTTKYIVIVSIICWGRLSYNWL